MPVVSPLRCVVAAFLIVAGLALAATARAQAIWSDDLNISGGDVNETFTGLNGQRFACVDDSNNLYIAFFDNRNKSSSDNNFEIYFRRFIYNFGSPYITRVTNASNQSRYPAIATRNWGKDDEATAQDSGRIYLAWQDARLFPIPGAGDPQSYTIFFRTFQARGGVGFGPEIQVSLLDSLNAAVAPCVTVGDSSRVWIVYHRAVNGSGNAELYYAVYNSAARTMGAEVRLTNDPAFSGNASIAATRDGAVHVTWVDTRTGGNQIWYKRFVPGSGWTADQRIVFSTGSASAPSLTATRSGHLHLVWVDNRDGNNEIYYKEYFPGTGWDPTDVRITLNGSTQNQPQADADPMDNVYVVWTDQRNGASNPDIYYAERKAGVWGAETPLVWAGSDPTNSVQRFPGITHDRVAELYVTWTDERLPASVGKNKDVYYKIGMGVITEVATAGRPSVEGLLRNYPNPFNPRTKVRFDLKRDAQTLLRVFDARGRLVRTLVDSYLAAGSRTVEWDGTDDGGAGVGSGTYFLRLEAAGEFRTSSVTLLK